MSWQANSVKLARGKPDDQASNNNLNQDRMVYRPAPVVRPSMTASWNRGVFMPSTAEKARQKSRAARYTGLV